MKFEDYTKAQQQAITAKGTNVIVSAGAGSGKTQVLTERVIYFIKNEGYNINDFLILTFTNLAASEMKERIRKALKKENLDKDNDVDQAKISTFDSYAFSIIKKYHFMLQLSPDINIVDSNIINVKKRLFLEEIFNMYFKNEKLDFLNLVKSFTFKDDKNLINFILKIYNKSDIALDTNYYLNNFIENNYNDDLYLLHMNMIFNDIKEYKKQLKELLNKIPDKQISKKNDISLKLLYIEQLKSFFESNTYVSCLSSLTEEVKENINIRLGNGFSEEERDLISLFKKTFNELYSFKEGLPSDYIEFKKCLESNIEYSKTIIEIIKLLRDKIFEYKRSKNIFEFNDIAKMALDLIKNNSYVRNTIKNELKMIMIDEYQDTSEIQEAFINQIENNNVYMVGDIKQSIYRFRNAKSDIFINKYNLYKNNKGGLAIDLNTNFRSKSECIDDFNYIFKSIMTNNFGGANYNKDHIIEFGNKSYNNISYDYDSHLEKIVYKKTDSNKIAETEASLIALDIINKVNNNFQIYDSKDNIAFKRNVKFSDFCILMDRGSSFDIYSKVFSEYNIPLYIENDENISTNDLVLILKNILILIKYIKLNNYNSPEFIKAFLSVSRSFIFEYTDTSLYNISKENSYKNDNICKTIKNIINEYNYFSDYELINKIIYELDIYYKLIKIGDVYKNEVYLDMFINLFNEMNKIDYQIDDFISYLENLDEYNLKLTISSSSTSLDSVKIMNIHKSKGLEFNIIYFSGLTKTFNRMDLNDALSITDNLGVIYENDDPNMINIIKHNNKTYEIYEDTSEKIRLFYVLLTRCRQKMIFLCPQDNVYKLKSEINKNIYYKYKTNDLVEIINLYKKKLINKVTLKSMLDDINIYISYKNFKYLDDLSKDEIIDICLNDNINVLKDSIDLLLKKFKYPSLVLKNILLESISNNDYDKVFDYAFLLNKKISNKFIESFDKLISEYEDGKDISKKIEEFIFDSEYELESFNYSHLDIYEKIKFSIKAYYKDEVDFDTLLIFFKLTGFIFNDDILELIENKDRFFNLIFNFKYSATYKETSFYNNLSKENQTGNTLCKLLYLYNMEYPYQRIFDLCIDKIYNKEIDANIFKSFMDDLKIIPLKATLNILEKLDIKISKEEIDIFKIRSYLEKISYSDESLSILEKYSLYDIANIYNEKFNNNEINYESYIMYLNCLDLELTLNNEIVKKRIDNSDIYKKNCFYDFIENIIKEGYKEYTYDLTLFKPKLKYINNIKYEDLSLKNIEIESNIINTFTASKTLTLGSSKKNMEFGTNIHLIMEVMDFKNPDYSILDKEYISIVKRFIDSDLMKNIDHGNIYKEYDFYDEENNINGIIDLMIIYENHIDIIDYKTKNINDESYNKQLNIYKEYISKLYKNKKIYCYLYSLLTGEYLKI